MNIAIEGLLFSWHKNVDYGSKLVADLTDEQMIVQPGAGVNHPAWVLSHMNAYHPVIVALVKGELFDDPKDHPFGMKSKPMSDASVYASKQQLVDDWVTGHEQVEAALTQAGDGAMGQAVKLPRWVPFLPTVGIALPYLMLVHENTHLGQLSTWRRVQGLPSV